MALAVEPIKLEAAIRKDVESASDPEPLIPGLTKELEASLVGLVKEFEQETWMVWRWFIREFLLAERFWKDDHYVYWDHDKDTWRPLSWEKIRENVGESGQRFTFVTNLYRAWGWTLISVLGQKIPTTRFFPADYRKEADVVTARSATDLAPLIERHNRAPLLNLRIAYLMYTHGIAGLYTRYHVDGERYGYREVMQQDPNEPFKTEQISEDRMECSQCFTESPVGTDICPNCGAEFTEADFVPGETAQIPNIVPTKVPRGRVQITVHGGLELRLPPWVDLLSDCPYLGLVNESHKSSLMHTYGKRAEGIEGPSTGATDYYDRAARLSLSEGHHTYYSTVNRNLVTVKRYWLRPSSFSMVKGDTVNLETGERRKKSEILKELFPEGAYVVIAEDKLLDARPEKMDDHWEVIHAHEGPGMYKPALGSSAISINKRINTTENLIMEWIEYSAAGQGTLVNSPYLNVNALSAQRRAPGMLYPVKAPPGTPLSNLIYESRPGQIASEIFAQTSRLTRLGQDVTGAHPTVSGGTEQSLKPTTYLADREQALGKMHGPWLHMRTGWANIMEKSVRLYSQNETEDEAYTVRGESGEYTGKTVAIEELQGSAQAFPETSEMFPELWHQQSALVLKLMEMAPQDEMLTEVMGHSKNLAFIKAMLGLPEIFVPREDDRTKQLIEIRQLLEGEPEVLDTPEGQRIISPSVAIEPFVDDHEVHVQVVKEWCVSMEGLRAKKQNPAGYMNVVAHGVAHEEFLKAQQLQLAAQAAAATQPESAPPNEEEAPPPE